MFTSGCRSWLKNVACLSSLIVWKTALSSLFGYNIKRNNFQNLSKKVLEMHVHARYLGGNATRTEHRENRRDCYSLCIGLFFLKHHSCVYQELPFLILVLFFPPFYFHFCFLMQKPLRIERQKGKAALGKLKLIEDLPKERCCVDNCVMVSVTSKL